MERYSAFHYYSPQGEMDVIRQLVMDVINPTNALQALEYAIHSAVCSGDGDCDSDAGLLSDIKNYIAIYAFVVFKHKSFYALSGRKLLRRLRDMHEGRPQHQGNRSAPVHLQIVRKKMTTDKQLDGLRSAWTLMTHDFAEPGSSIWSQIRLSSILMREFVKFIKENKRCFSSYNALNISTFLYSCAEPTDTADVANVKDEVIGVHLSKKRKTLQPISFYPRNLEFHGLASPQTDISYWDDSKIKLFVAFDFSSKEATTLPPVHFHNNFVHCTVYRADRSLGVSGNIHGKTGVSDSATEITITSSVVCSQLPAGSVAEEVGRVVSCKRDGVQDTYHFVMEHDRKQRHAWLLVRCRKTSRVFPEGNVDFDVFVHRKMNI